MCFVSMIAAKIEDNVFGDDGEDHITFDDVDFDDEEDDDIDHVSG